ncbi:MAG: DUF4003 family protein [Paraclostridium sp.]|uniref:DUF4003 family protein n=1 Tax=Paraclostridium sp. TaxID=2023273 RepID=UPI003F39E466
MEYKVNLLTKNYESLKKVKAASWMGIILHGCALTYTLKDKEINVKLVNECIDLIRDNTSIFSDFRGNSSVNTAIILSLQPNPKSSLEEILEIHKKLKQNKFYSGDCLALVANTIFENKNRINIDECIGKMKYIYESMRQNHPFLTSVDDYMSACTMAINSTNIEEDLKNMEDAYEYLNKNGFHRSNTLQSLAQILAYTHKKTVWDNCIYIKKELEIKKCKLHEFGYPLIGIMALLELNDVGYIIEKIKELSNDLKQHKSYGNFSLGENYRNMICAIIIISEYTKKLDINSFIINTIIDDINQAMNIAIITATTSAIIINNSST